MKRLTDDELSQLIDQAHELHDRVTQGCIISTACSNLALIEIQLRLLDKIKR
jgi:hypothetical protein